MTTIDFYILTSNKAPRHNLFACKLTEKIYKSGHSLFINTRNLKQSEQLDTMLWTFRETSFVPHSLVQSNPIDTKTDSDCTNDKDGNNNIKENPIQIAFATHPNEQHTHGVLLNLADQVPSFFSSFPRVAEIVSQTGDQKNNARNRFKYYRDRGYKINTHNI
ncbi:DNA polymerase III chi subunit [hydrothermal vent metagenome]|uniref:DNA polymerase III chi subunit n=1 Tax=hydrothermal vent metagenome TaxID=652676 RepID=A0A3B0YSJ4_9ZZZZ